MKMFFEEGGVGRGAGNGMGWMGFEVVHIGNEGELRGGRFFVV